MRYIYLPARMYISSKHVVWAEMTYLSDLAQWITMKSGSSLKSPSKVEAKKV